MNTRYSIKHKVSGLLFGGFNADQSVKWVNENRALTMSKVEATAQALLLSRFGSGAQKKPVQL